jgi:threonine synthase
MGTPLKTRLSCAGCLHDAQSVEREPFPFRCARAEPGDDIDHVMRRTLHVAAWREAPAADAGPAAATPGAANPLVQYRRRLYTYHLARAHGLADADFVDLVSDLDRRVASYEGHGHAATPFGPADRLGETLDLAAGTLWVKDETGSVGGSHKIRHLAGVLVYLRVVETLLERGLLPEDAPGIAHIVAEPAAPLAIASCGNAALAASILARAAGRQLDAYVPPSAELPVLEQLAARGARLVTCPRREGERGDPTYLRFREALLAGAVPFCCQGPENGLTIEGGQTLVYEMLDTLGAAPLDRLFVQVGGGAFASACVRGFEEALAAGTIARLPRVHAVQTDGAWPLARAYDRVAALLLARVDPDGGWRSPAIAPDERADAAHAILRLAAPADIRAVMREAVTHRASYMWPWEREPHGLAHAILDDETYDWAAVVEGMLASGGWPLVVTDGQLAQANAAAQERTGTPVCVSGSAGLAGLFALQQAAQPGMVAPGERVAVVFSGRQR